VEWALDYLVVCRRNITQQRGGGGGKRGEGNATKINPARSSRERQKHAGQNGNCKLGPSQPGGGSMQKKLQNCDGKRKSELLRRVAESRRTHDRRTYKCGDKCPTVRGGPSGQTPSADGKEQTEGVKKMSHLIKRFQKRYPVRRGGVPEVVKVVTVMGPDCA